MDREAAKESLSHFLSGKTLNAAQIEFVDLVVNQLTAHGVVEPRMLYESPFTDFGPHGPDASFESSEIDVLITALEDVRQRASFG